MDNTIFHCGQWPQRLQKLWKQYTLVTLIKYIMSNVYWMIGEQPRIRSSVLHSSHRRGGGVNATCFDQHLSVALRQSCDMDYRKRFLNLYTIAIINANYGTRIVPMERWRHIYHGNGDNSISTNDHLPHYSTLPPIYNLIKVTLNLIEP